MPKLLALAALPLLATLGACGGGNDITVTNDNNVVLNDAQANYAFTNDGDLPANDTGAMMPAPANGTADDMSGADNATSNMAMPE